MSTSSVSSSTSSTASTGYQLTSLGTGSPLQITGMASGLDTNQIVTELMSLQEQPVTALQNQVTGITAENTQLTSIQSALQTLAADAQALNDPSMYSTVQAVSSGDPTRITATSTTGAAIGGYQVSVSQLANSAQRGFTYSSANADSISIDDQPVSITSGESISDFANSINSNPQLDVYAAATGSNTVVFSNRATGNTDGKFIDVTDTGGALTANGLAVDGQDADYTVGTQPGTSSSNTVTGAIPGVSLTLTGVTTTSGPVTVNVSPPAPSSTNIGTALSTFVTQYNSVISQIETQLSQAPSSSDPTQGTLYGDSELQGLLTQMRSSMYSEVSGTDSGMSNLDDIGLNTGATTGTGAVSQSSLDGDLALNATTLQSALQSNPTGVQHLLQYWSSSFSLLVNNEGSPGGNLDQRIEGDTSQISQTNSQIASMQSLLTDKQAQLTQQFAQMEAALSQNQSTSSWLTSTIAQLPG
ncbi:MAG: flagellar filament capping protein FliD [Solirubrobacteraceae bacterium]